MTCHNCQSNCNRFGKHRNGLQRYRCSQCRRTFTEDHTRPLADMRLPVEKAIAIVRLFVEGCSVRSIERITSVHRDTILRVLVLAGERCERLLADTITNLQVRDVECDEMWGFVAMKEKAKGNLYKNVDAFGDAYTYVAIERNSKLILAWHLGKRNRQDTLTFITKLRRATIGKFQLSTDGWPSYPDAVERVFGADIHYAQLIKVYGASRDGEQRYSPAEVVDVEVVPRVGMPDYERICTSCRAPEPHDEDADSQADAAHQCVLEKMGEPESGCGVAFRVVQLCARSQELEGDTRDGGTDYGTSVDTRRTTGSGLDTLLPAYGGSRSLDKLLAIRGEPIWRRDYQPIRHLH